MLTNWFPIAMILPQLPSQISPGDIVLDSYDCVLLTNHRGSGNVELFSP